MNVSKTKLFQKTFNVKFSLNKRLLIQWKADDAYSFVIEIVIEGI